MYLIAFGVVGAVALFFVWSLLKRLHIGSEVKGILEHGSEEAKLEYERAERVYVDKIRPAAMVSGWVTITALFGSLLFMLVVMAHGVPYTAVMPGAIAALAGMLVIAYFMSRDHNHLSIFSLVSWSAIALWVCGFITHLSACYAGSVELAVLGGGLMVASLGVTYLLAYLMGVGGKKLIEGIESLFKAVWAILRILLLSTGQKGAAEAIGNAPDIAPEEKILPDVNVVFANILFVLATFLAIDINWCDADSPTLVMVVSSTTALSLFMLAHVGIKTAKLRKRGTRIVVAIALTGMVWFIFKKVFPKFLAANEQAAGMKLIADIPSKIGSTTLLLGDVVVVSLGMIIVIGLTFFAIDYVESKTDGLLRWLCRMGLAGLVGLSLYMVAWPAFQLTRTDVVAGVRERQGVQMAQAPSAQPSATPAPKPAPAPGPTTAQPARKVPANAVASKGHAHRGANMQEICKLTGECPQ